jgi:hypothetical protein
MRFLPGCYFMTCFTLWPTHLLQETASPVQRNRATSGPTFAFFLPASFTGLGLGWAPQRRQGEEEVVTAASELFTIVHKSGMFGLEIKEPGVEASNILLRPTLHRLIFSASLSNSGFKIRFHSQNTSQ